MTRNRKRSAEKMAELKAAIGVVAKLKQQLDCCEKVYCTEQATYVLVWPDGSQIRTCYEHIDDYVQGNGDVAVYNL